jgi:hypothetical protein
MNLRIQKQVMYEKKVNRWERNMLRPHRVEFNEYLNTYPWRIELAGVKA